MIRTLSHCMWETVTAAWLNAPAGTAVDQPAITAASVGPLEGTTSPCVRSPNPAR